MKCGSCKVNINSEFTHAITSNQCPACGRSIMDKSRLTSFLSLRALLENNMSQKNVDIDKIASLIVANFEVKQIFKDSDLQNDDNLDSTLVNEKEEMEADPDAEFKKKQREESKKILAKMREDALSGALEDRYGMDDDAGILIPDGEVNLYEVTSKAKQENSRDAVLSGTGKFSRSG